MQLARSGAGIATLGQASKSLMSHNNLAWSREAAQLLRRKSQAHSQVKKHHTGYSNILCNHWRFTTSGAYQHTCAHKEKPSEANEK